MFAEDVPYRVGIIDLEENVRLVTRLQDDMAIGDASELVVLEYEDGPLFAARPLSDSSRKNPGRHS